MTESNLPVTLDTLPHTSRLIDMKRLTDEERQIIFDALDFYATYADLAAAQAAALLLVSHPEFRPARKAL